MTRRASLRSDLQLLDRARGGHVAAVLAGAAGDRHVLRPLAFAGGRVVAGGASHLAAVLAADDQVPAGLEGAVAAGALDLAVHAVRARRAAVDASGVQVGADGAGGERQADNGQAGDAGDGVSLHDGVLRGCVGHSPMTIDASAPGLPLGWGRKSSWNSGTKSPFPCQSWILSGRVCPSVSMVAVTV